ncbi:MAG TPA: hypothetical protein VMS96_10615 [Terriglobales bacterium]|nr:hypothetical protein [Terriglobales bacterium]
MGRTLMNIIGRCSHEFSWPRRWSDGAYYQVCLLCGDEWAYDWKRMRRTERITAGRFAERVMEGARKGPRPVRKPTWTPRARRLKLQNTEMRFRERGTQDWLAGTAENISNSGVLFRTDNPVRENASIELILEMPKEITGQEHSTVLCSCTVVRTELPEEEGKPRAYAAVLWDYRFLHEYRDRRHPAVLCDRNH